MEAKIMTKKQQNNHPGTGYLTKIKFMISGLQVISVSCYGLLLKNYLCHGASGIAWRKKRSSSVEDALLPIIAISTLIGSNARSLAVRSIVMMIETLRLPRSVMFPKDIFLNKTAFLIPCSAGLFVGGIAVYFRNTKSSSLNVIRRLRILSVLWCSSSGWERNFLNRLRISLQAERYSSLLSAGCML